MDGWMDWKAIPGRLQIKVIQKEWEAAMVPDEMYPYELKAQQNIS